MANITVKKGLIGQEDINLGTGTFSRAKSDGSTQTITKVNAEQLITLPAGTRTVSTVTDYLANGAVHNVKDYGALGDGSTDDTAAIQAAIDATEAAGGTVYFPPGTFVFTTVTWAGTGTAISYIGIPGPIFQGSGYATILKSTAASGVAITVKGDASVNDGSHKGLMKHAALRDFTLLGPGSGTAAGIECSAYVSLLIENVFIRDAGGDGLVLKRDYFNPGTQDDRALLTNLKNVSARGCGGDGLDANSTEPIDNLHIEGCDFSENTGFGMNLFPWYGNVQNCYMGGNTKAGLFVGGVSSQPAEGFLLVSSAIEGNGRNTTSSNVELGYCHSATLMACKLSAVDVASANLPGTLLTIGESGPAVETGRVRIINPFLIADTVIGGVTAIDVVDCTHLEIDSPVFNSGISTKVSNANNQSVVFTDDRVVTQTGTADTRIYDGSATTYPFQLRVTGDSQPRLRFVHDGRIQWGTGSAGPDTVLQRATLAGSTNALQVVGALAVQSQANGIFAGSGTPEAAVTATVGSIYLRTDGGASTSLYVKETGSSNTGWVAK